MSALSDPFDPRSLGLSAATTPAPRVAAEQPMASMAKTAVRMPDHPLWSPDNPLLWFGGLLAITVGLIGVTVSGHAGPLRASVSAGK